MPIAWRLSEWKFRETALSGEGAALYGGRWNTPGSPVVYTAGSLALATLETLVRLRRHRLPRFVCFRVEFDESLVESIELKSLRRSWASDPPRAASQRVGDRWLREGTAPVLRVPSVIVPRESNYLLNPQNANFSDLRFGPPETFRFDPRLLGYPPEKQSR